ncbi:hypothetical protein M9H77_35469 [Catharanthus roseus]|uniref:Uncharacterized protein n=1 Tax=Catharanthus roseus TaxID=4058 RepID=A0ACB9ZQ08_CATRO|nr:hypothetical protein M9H77_35469 [Catharanthus roseus]
MGFFSFLGRVLFASLFILSAWQMFNEFGDDGGPAAKEWAPKLVVIQKFLTLKFGKGGLNIDVRHFVAASIALKGLGGLLFVFGSSMGAYLLMYHLLYTTPLFYDFYNYRRDEPEFSSNLQECLQVYLHYNLIVSFFSIVVLRVSYSRYHYYQVQSSPGGRKSKLVIVQDNSLMTKINELINFLVFNSQDYLKTVVPSQLLAERGSNLVVINPGSGNIRIGLAQQDTPLNIPHCIARRTSGTNQFPKKNVQDQGLNSHVTTAQHMEREKAYDIIASLLKIPFLDEEITNNSFPRKMGRVDAIPSQNNKKEAAFTWTDVYERTTNSSSTLETSVKKDYPSDSPVEKEGNESSSRQARSTERRYKEYIFGEEAMKISPTEPYCLRRPIRRGHLNISQHYPLQQVLEDLNSIWDWILTEKLHIPQSERNMYAAILVVPETFDNREIKEVLSLILRDLRFGSAVVHQEGLAAVFGNGLSTACVVNLGAQVTSVICVESSLYENVALFPNTDLMTKPNRKVDDFLKIMYNSIVVSASFQDGVALPTTQISLRYGGEDISRCLLWTQRHHQTWPPVRTDALTKPVDLLMLNRLRESYCSIREGELDTVAVVHSYDDGMPPGSHKTRLTALNVPPMGLFYPTLLVADVHPPPPRTWFKDYDDMLEDTWHTEFFPSSTGAYPMWESYPVFQARPKKEDNIGLAEAITKSILSTENLHKSLSQIGGVALTEGLIPAVEERVLHAIPSNEAIDTVEVLQSRTNPSFVPWKGGVVLGILDISRDTWIHREDWIRSGIHIGSGRKYKDSYYLQAQAMSNINS